MSTRVDVEEIQTTKSEKLLAAVLALFVFIGGIWTYQEIDDQVAGAIALDYRGTATDQAALAASARAFGRVARANAARERAEEQLEFSREAYRTALDERRRAPDLRRAYEQAQARLERANREVAAAEDAAAATRPAADEANRRIGDELEKRDRRRAVITFAGRFAFTALLLAAGYWLLGRLRRRGSRYFAVAAAVVIAAAILAFVGAADYITDYVDPLDLGPLLLALFGIAVTLLAFVALQRYLARRLPARRARKSECPFCGYPVRGNRFCEGCGREVIAACARCSQPRRVGVARCGACGAA